MDKRCSNCEIPKPLAEFRWKNKTKGQRISLCKECDKAYRAERYARRKLRMREIHDRAVERRRALVAKKAVQEPDVLRCIDCCQTKDKNQFRWKNKSLLRRISRCRECDVIYRSDVHEGNKEQFLANNKRNYKRLRRIVDKHKRDPCVDCGQHFPPCAMDFDHRDPSTKIAKVSSLVYRGSKRLLLEEIAKCDLVCAVCHRIRTHLKKRPNSDFNKESNSAEKDNDESATG